MKLGLLEFWSIGVNQRAKMIPLRVAVLLFPLMVNFHETSGECPPMEDIPVMKNNDTFTCMRFWDEYGDDLTVNACNGEYKTRASASVLRSYYCLA